MSCLKPKTCNIWRPFLTYFHGSHVTWVCGVVTDLLRSTPRLRNILYICYYCYYLFCFIVFVHLILFLFILFSSSYINCYCHICSYTHCNYICKHFYSFIQSVCSKLTDLLNDLLGLEGVEVGLFLIILFGWKLRKRRRKKKSYVFHFISMSTYTNMDRHCGRDTPFHVC